MNKFLRSLHRIVPQEFFSLFLFVTVSTTVCAQTPFDPCAPGGPGCSTGPAIMMVTDKCGDTLKFGPAFDFVAGALDINGKIDTTYNAPATISVAAGPGSLNGTVNVNVIKGIVWFKNLNVSTQGTYTLSVISGTLAPLSCKKTFDPNYIPHGGNMCKEAGPSVKVKFYNLPMNVTTNAPFNIEVHALNNKGCTDTTAAGAVNLSKHVGPGALLGPTTANFNKGVAFFNGVKVDQQGAYRFIASSGALINDTSMNVNASGGGNNNNVCPPTAVAGKRDNLGLYGGSSLDLTFSNSTKRLFAAISNPASLFHSDDTANTWKRSFPADSLEYGCGRGWGGRAVRVLTNNVGWVAVQTSQEAGTLNALVISYTNGDSGTWKTAMDPTMLQKLGLNGGMSNVSGMGLSDYYMYCLMGKYIIRVHNSSPINNANDVRDATAIPGMNSKASVKSIAVANHSSGYPIYFVVDTTGNFGNSTNGLLIKYDGTSYTQITLPVGASAVNIFSHPNGTTADTLILSAQNGPSGKTYRSYNGGSTWTDVSYPGPSVVSDVDYSPSWVSQMPASKGAVMIIPGVALSKDFGTTWISIGLQNNGGAVHPTDTNIVVGTKGRGVALSKTGTVGPYHVCKNYGLEAVLIKKIAKTNKKGMFYLATKAGLAYTIAYNNTSVIGFDKWNGVYGQFPVANVGDDAGVSAVAIDPNDSLHVIAGYSNGFALTKTGVSGFNNVTPAGWNASMGDPIVRDILFVNSTIVLAVTGGENDSHKDKGNIWRSADGGTNWTKVSPVNFNNGNALAMGVRGTDTVVYVGTGLSAQNDGVLWKSSDKGLSWTKVNDGPTSKTNPGVMRMPIYDLAVDPRSRDTLYIASGSNLDYAFVRSTDGGATYKTTNARGEGAFTSVAVNTTHPDTVYTAIRRDIIAYDAVNDSVTYIYRGLPGELVPDLAIGSVLAGTSMGFYKVKQQAIIITQLDQSVINLDENQVFPNPFSETTTLVFALKNTENVSIRVYDMMGREVMNVLTTRMQSGKQSVEINAAELPKGNYIIRLVTEHKVIVNKVVKM